MKKAAAELYWDALTHERFPDRPLYLAATENGLSYITQPNESFDTLKRWADTKMPKARLIRSPERMAEYVRQLTEYFDGERKQFTLPFDLYGTPYQISVWEALLRIPYGQACSYSKIAEAAGRPQAIRAAGAANGANPVPFVIPCHRVIGKNAALTGYRGGLQVKEALLRLEGFETFKNKGHERFRF